MIRSFFRFVGSFCFFAGPLCALAFAGLMISMSDVFGSINPGTLDRETLIQVMQLRDFQTLPPQTVAAITDRAEAEFGRKSSQKPIFKFSPTRKKIYVYFQKNRSKQKSHFEANLNLMARTRYFQWMNDYSAASPEERTVMMNDVADDMNYWGTIYIDFLNAAGLPVPSFAELFQEFENMIEKFKIGATSEEVVRIDEFKLRLNSALVAREVRGAAKNLTGNVSSAVSNVFGTFIPLPKKKEKKPPQTPNPNPSFP